MRKCARLRHLMYRKYSKDILVFLNQSLRSLSSLEVSLLRVFREMCVVRMLLFSVFDSLYAICFIDKAT